MSQTFSTEKPEKKFPDSIKCLTGIRTHKQISLAELRRFVIQYMDLDASAT